MELPANLFDDELIRVLKTIPVAKNEQELEKMIKEKRDQLSASLEEPTLVLPAKKKKKKPAKEQVDDIPTFDVVNEMDETKKCSEDVPDFVILPKKKKKKQKPVEDDEPNPDKTIISLDSDRDYAYSELLSRFYGLMQKELPNRKDKQKVSITAPRTQRVGGKRSMWVNFNVICGQLHRSCEHFQSFVLAEFGTTGSLDSHKRLILKGKYLPQDLESLITKYIQEYVTCQNCQSLETLLIRDTVSRLHFIQCEHCHARKSVKPVKSGFKAVSKGDRQKARNATSGYIEDKK
jgi:translation initiation factor 2 subunit 2